jgi:outer membrane protein OmpA-like peptidoglycan-associated protein
LIIALELDTAQAINARPPGPVTITEPAALPAAPATPAKGAKMGVEVPVSSHCFAAGTTVTITDIKTGKQQTIQPDALGEAHFDLTLDHQYVIANNAISDTISTKGLKPGSQLNGACQYTVGETWAIPNLYYDVNKWSLRKDAAAKLDQLARLMKKYPDLEIILTSHTDCRASSRYNMILSARRAKSAVDYMVRRGIKAKRFIAIGYGESHLTNDCYCEPSNYSTCEEPKHQANRRTEVTVLKY